MIASIVVPSAVPQILRGVRIAIAISWVVATVSEILYGNTGLGVLLNDGRSLARPDQIIRHHRVVILGKGTDTLVVRLQRRLTSWQSALDGMPATVRGSSPPGAPGVSTAITFDGVTKAFPEVGPVLERIDLESIPGTFVALLGPSGCGKSTMLRLVLGLDRDHGGEIRFGGERRDASVAMAFQEPRLLPWRDVRGNLELVADRRHQERWKSTICWASWAWPTSRAPCPSSSRAAWPNALAGAAARYRT